MYEKVSTKLDFTSREEKVLKFWKENEIFEKSIEEKKDLPTYTFYDGPPTANGKPKKALSALFEDQPCIVIGRASDYAYKEHPDAVRIFLCGDKKTRISKIAKKHQVSELKAKMIVDDTDRRRKQYHNYYSGETWGLADNYDLCLDECKLGIDGVAAVVSAYIGQINGKD